jgi:predicted nucleotidyltransferase component of viral defense system
VLNALYDEQLVFKGGTYLWFFYGLQRFSEDLDFTVLSGINSGISEKVSKSLSLLGVANEARIESDDKSSFSFKIMAHGPLYSSQNSRCVVYVEISKRENVLNETVPVKLDLPEYQLPVRILMGMNLDEVAAEKVRAIMSRNKARDAYDLYYLIKEKKVKFNRELADKKLDYIKKSFSLADFRIALDEKGRIFEKELANLVFRPLPRFEEVKSVIEEWLKR